MRPDNRVHGTVSSIELTSIKLIVSSLVALILACFLEGGNNHNKESWWIAFLNLPQSTKLGVIGGAVLISVFQANCTFLTFLTNSITVGLTGQVKIIPQWMTAVMFSTKLTNFTVKPTAILGAALICGSAAIFALSNWMQWKEQERALELEQEQEEHDKGAGGDGNVLLLQVSEGDNTPVANLGNVQLPPPQALSVPASSAPGTVSRRGSLLYADADHWGAASLLSSFIEDESESLLNGSPERRRRPLLLNPPMSPGGNLSTRGRLNSE
jgi:hypothetical protein